MSDPVKIQVKTADGKQRVLWTLAGKSLWEVLTEGALIPAEPAAAVVFAANAG